MRLRYEHCLNKSFLAATMYLWLTGVSLRLTVKGNPYFFFPLKGRSFIYLLRRQNV